MHPQKHLVFQKKINCFTSMLYPGIDHKYTSSIFEEHSDDFKKINEFKY